MIPRNRSLRECSSSERTSPSSNGERRLPGVTSPHSEITRRAPTKAVRERSARRVRDRQSRNKGKSLARQVYPSSSPTGRQAPASSASSGFVHEDSLFECNGESSEKRIQHPHHRSPRPAGRRRCRRSGSRNSHESVNQTSISDGETEWFVGNLLLRSIGAALKTSTNGSPKRPRWLGPADTDTLPSTEKSTPRQEYDPAQMEDAREHALDSDMGLGDINDVMKPVKWVGKANSKEARELHDEAGFQSNRPVHHHNATCLGSEQNDETRGGTSEAARAAPMPQRSHRAGHRETHGCGARFAAGGRSLTKAEMLIARQLFCAIRATVREETRCYLNEEGDPLLSSGKWTREDTTAAQDTNHLHVAMGRGPAERNFIATLRKQPGGEDSQKGEGGPSVAKPAVGCSEAAAAGAVHGRIAAEGKTAPHHSLEQKPESCSSSPNDVKDEQNTPAQDIRADASCGGASSPVARPSARKTIAQQVDEVSARLERVFVLPLT